MLWKVFILFYCWFALMYSWHLLGTDIWSSKNDFAALKTGDYSLFILISWLMALPEYLLMVHPIAWALPKMVDHSVCFNSRLCKKSSPFVFLYCFFPSFSRTKPCVGIIVPSWFILLCPYILSLKNRIYDFKKWLFYKNLYLWKK